MWERNDVLYRMAQPLKCRSRQISELCSYKTRCQERTLLKRITQNGWVTRISKLRTRDILTRGKILFALLASLSGQIFFKNKIPFTPKCLRLKWLLRRTQWSHGKISLRTMGLGREGVGSSGPGFLNLSMQNVSLTGVGWPLKNSNIFDYSFVGHMLAIAPCSAAMSIFQFFILVAGERVWDQD